MQRPQLSKQDNSADIDNRPHLYRALRHEFVDRYLPLLPYAIRAIHSLLVIVGWNGVSGESAMTARNVSH